MDAQQFDRLTQHVSHAISRRRLGALLAALVLAAGLGAESQAKPKKKKKKKPAGCAGGTVACGGACVDTQFNAQHCGGCGRSCESGQTCSGGECRTGGCPGNRDLCGGECVDTETDTRHCGGCGATCDPGQCVGGECIECVDQYGCGGFSSFNDLVCNTATGRCVCANEDEGLCQRYSDGRGSCDKCCPGGSGECRFDEICFYVQGPNGPYGFCDCPTGWQRCNYNPHPTGTCVQDPKTDSRKCGPFCEDCRTGETGAICCGGLCTRGCGGPGTLCFNQDQPCGPNCLPCNSDSICCNMGPGTLPRCIPNAHGNVCYQN